MIITLLILLAIFAFIVVTYNGIISKSEAVESSKKQIDIQLDRRFKVFESLMNVVRKSMDYEQNLLKEIVQLRSDAQTAKSQGNIKKQFSSEDQISKIGGVFFESYPQLKSLDNALQLQEEIVSTENKLSFAKQAYNDSVENYNIIKKSFFSSIILNLFSVKLDHNYEYWQITSDKAQSYEEMTVKL